MGALNDPHLPADYAVELEAYAAYLNARHRASEHFDAEALAEFDEDLERAKAAMERSYLERQWTR